MRWEDGRKSDNVEDRRGSRLPLAAGGGIGALVIAVVVLLLGGDPSEVLQQTQPGPEQPTTGTDGKPDQASEFIRSVLASTEDVWTPIFAKAGRTYEKPKLVLFSGRVDSACGRASTAVGPFYCPIDRKVYIDLQFYESLKNDLKAPGDFAQAYVISHEVGHHVQTLLGISEQVNSAQASGGRGESNQLSVRQELQADCFAGVWGNHSQADRKWLQEGDIEEALGAASAIGDDRLQQRQQGYVVPESFTHGTSAQRVEWFRKGFETGDMNQCDTFR